MGKESIIKNFVTNPCGHVVNQKLVGIVHEMIGNLKYDGEYQSLVKEVIPWAFDFEEELTEEEKLAYIATTWLDYLGYTDEEDIQLCSGCDKERLKSWIEASQA